MRDWPDGHDPRRVDLERLVSRNLPRRDILTYVRVGPKVVCLDVLKVGGGLKSVFLPIQPTQPAGHNRGEQRRETTKQKVTCRWMLG